MKQVYTYHMTINFGGVNVIDKEVIEEVIDKFVRLNQV